MTEDEKRRVTISLPTSAIEAMNAHRTALQRQAEMLAEVQNEMRSSLEGLSEFVQSMQKVSLQIADIMPDPEELERGVRIQMELAEILAEEGWTYPMDTTPQYVSRLVDEHQGELDEAMLAL